jgi:DNA-binding MarR family transcriptional regulator
METDRNFLLLDRFRQVARLMRMGWTPDDIPTVKEKMIRTSTASSGDSCVRLFKREMILGVLMLSEDGMNQREIAEEMGVSPSTLSEMINRLVEDGYVYEAADLLNDYQMMATTPDSIRNYQRFRKLCERRMNAIVQEAAEQERRWQEERRAEERRRERRRRDALEGQGYSRR